MPYRLLASDADILTRRRIICLFLFGVQIRCTSLPIMKEYGVHRIVADSSALIYPVTAYFREGRRIRQLTIGKVMGVEVQINNNTIDAAFVQEEQHRPKLRGAPTQSSAAAATHNLGIDLSGLRIDPAGDQIPLIDLSPLQTDPLDETALASLVSQVGKACRDWGFFQVVNHGLPIHLLRILESAAHSFFSLPLEEKRKASRDEQNPLGYYDTELTKNVRDWKEVFDFATEDTLELPARFEGDDDRTVAYTNRWPRDPPHLREACQNYAAAAHKLALGLLELISRSLGLPAARLNGYVERSTSFMRLNCYPPCPAPQMALGVGRHKDAGVLTVLYQDEVGGLEVRRKDGEWIGVKPVADSFVINVGDCVQVWSNDLYESVEHRVVVNDSRRRLSIPFFFNPSRYAMVKPLEELLSQDNPAKYREYNWGKFFKRRKDGDFKHLGVENLQIYHFKISM